MAEIVLGVGTSHSPMLSVPPELWDEYAQVDKSIKELIFPPSGHVMTFDEAMDSVDQSIRDKPRDIKTYRALAARCDAALALLTEEIARARPDVVVIVSNDQDEWFFEDNLPALAVYWGDTVQVVPRTLPGKRTSAIAEAIKTGFGAEEREIAVASDLGRHLVETLMDRGFDPAQLTYVPPVRGGVITRRYATTNRPIDERIETPPRPQGLPHGFAFVVTRLLQGIEAPILPVFLNTCYPPNAVGPTRGYDVGQVLAEAVSSWESDARVVVVGSGGLSHLVVDEEADTHLLSALARGDIESLATAPAYRYYSASSEAVNWIALAGAVSGAGLDMNVVDYVPAYRTEVGTGGGWAFATWGSTSKPATEQESIGEAAVT